MGLSRRLASTLVVLTAVMLLSGAIAFASAAPGRDRPHAEDLPAITLDVQTSATNDTPAPPVTHEPTAPVLPQEDDDDASHETDDDDDREVVTPEIRDSDDEHDDGESSEHEDSESHPHD